MSGIDTSRIPHSPNIAPLYAPKIDKSLEEKIASNIEVIRKQIDYIQAYASAGKDYIPWLTLWLNQDGCLCAMEGPESFWEIVDEEFSKNLPLQIGFTEWRQKIELCGWQPFTVGYNQYDNFYDNFFECVNEKFLLSEEIEKGGAHTAFVYTLLKLNQVAQCAETRASHEGLKPVLLFCKPDSIWYQVFSKPDKYPTASLL